MENRDEDKALSPSAQNDNERCATRPHNRAVLIYTTFPSPGDAKKAGRALVEQRLAACVNIFASMTAIYMWEDKIEEEGETAMIVKTTDARSTEVLEEIKRLHPYSVPARLILPVIGGGDDFLNWIAGQCEAVS